MDFTFDLSMEYSQEDYDAIFDTDFEHTDEVFLYNRKGEEFHFIKPIYCKECKWYDPPHIKYNDGSRKDVEEDELWVTSDVGINVGGTCKNYIDLKIHCLNHNREDPEDEPNIIIFRKPTDFCSYGERRTDERIAE